MVYKKDLNGKQKESKIELVKNLIFGEEINSYDKKFSDITTKIDAIEKSFTDKINALENKIDQQFQSLDTKLDTIGSTSEKDVNFLKENINSLKDEIYKKLELLDKKSVEKSKLANLLKNLTEE